jgi:hypothetical protein
MARECRAAGYGGAMRGGILLAGALTGTLLGAGGGAAATHPATPRDNARQAPAAAPRWPDRLRYALDLAYDTRRFALAGTERITFRNDGPAPLGSVWLRTWANAFGGCDTPRARVTVVAGGTAGERRRDCTALEVRLDRPLAPGAEATLALRIAVGTPTASAASAARRTSATRSRSSRSRTPADSSCRRTPSRARASTR